MDTIEQRADNLVRNEVHYCVSSLVSILAAGYAHTISGHYKGKTEMAELFEQAFELSCPIDDWEEAAREAGFEVRHDMHGFYWCSQDEAEFEDAGHSSVGFDGRDHFDTIETAARECCDENHIDPYQWEVYEHWIVSDTLGRDLAELGEKVDFDFAGLTVWARTTTGQAISQDGVIRRVPDLLDKRISQS